VRKSIGVCLVLLLSTVAYAVHVGCFFTPGIWVGDGSDRSAPMHVLGFQAGSDSIGYELSTEYRKWKATDYGFYVLNFDNYLALNINAGNPISLFIMPMVGYGVASYTDLPEYYVSESYEVVNLGGKFGVRGECGDGLATIDMYFYYRGGMVQGSEDLDYMVTTKIGLDAYVRPINHLGVKLSVGGLSDNFYFYEGMGSYYHLGSPFIALGPEFYF
jgi:hypothetical protein